MIPRILEVGLFLFFIIHIIQGYVLELHNRSRRGHAYKVAMGSEGSNWYRKSMGLLGTLIFIFLVVHIANFWVPSRFGGLEEVTYPDGSTFHNLYGSMITAFQELWVVVLYVVGCISLAWHLIHGFQSAFRTIGVSNKKYLALLNAAGIVFSLLVSGLFAAMPISIYLGWVK
jgi:succinate dehydrogenase / fumarate reductase cytochrome b subunit